MIDQHNETSRIVLQKINAKQVLLPILMYMHVCINLSSWLTGKWN